MCQGPLMVLLSDYCLDNSFHIAYSSLSVTKKCQPSMSVIHYIYLPVLTQFARVWQWSHTACVDSNLLAEKTSLAEGFKHSLSMSACSLVTLNWVLLEFDAAALYKSRAWSEVYRHRHLSGGARGAYIHSRIRMEYASESMYLKFASRKTRTQRLAYRCVDSLYVHA